MAEMVTAIEGLSGGAISAAIAAAVIIVTVGLIRMISHKSS